jgi:dimethylargininase
LQYINLLEILKVLMWLNLTLTIGGILDTVLLNMVRNEGDKLRRVVVCTPQKEYFNVRNPDVHNITQRADQKKAVQQHAVLKAIMHQSGCEVIDIPELSDHPNSIFTRDTAVCTPEGYIKLRMGLETRRGEDAWMAQTLDALGEPCAGGIKAPGTVEGGDIILAGKVAFVGCSQRTNENGVQQISKFLRSMNYEVRLANMPPTRLHIGGAMSMVGPRRIVCCPDVFPSGFFDGFETIEISSDTFISGNVICLVENEVIAEKENAEVISKLRQAGILVHDIDLSEFVKGRGGPTCLIVPVERK